MFCNSLKKILLAVSVLLPFGADCQTYKAVDDMALIWIGGRHRPDWNKELFTPYLVHDFEDGHRSWLFDGFLMLESHIQTPDGSVSYSYGEAQLIPADKELWEMLLTRQLGVDTGLGCKALDDRIGELIPELGQPSYKHKVVMMTPVPMIQSARNWGDIDGTTLNFERLDDRIIAIKWYVDQLIERWNAADFKNIELAGVYWLRESVNTAINEHLMAIAANEYIHSKGLLSYWIPYFKATNYEKWQDYGFDQVYLQPNYVFSLDRPDSQLDTAIDDAYEHDLGLEMEFEGNIIEGLDDKRVVKPQWNSCLYDHSKDYFARFERYVKRFEEEAVFGMMPLAYYNGYQAIYDFANSKNPKDRELLDQLSSNIESRHIESGWYDPANAGVSEITSPTSLNVYGLDGAIYVGDSCPDVKVYSIDGRLFINLDNMTAKADTDYAYGTAYPCPAGIYIVRSGNVCKKIVVR